MPIYINRDAPESGIASLLALQGTKGDTELVHMTKPEVKMMMNTGLMSMNSETGLPQFAKGKNILGSLLPMIAGLVFPPLLGPSIGMALGVGSVASSAIAGGMGTALAGMLTGDDPADALTKGLLSGGLSYGAGSLFPETFGFDQAANPDAATLAGSQNKFPGADTTDYATNIAQYGDTPIDAPISYWEETAGFLPKSSLDSPVPDFPGSGGQFRSRPIMEMGGEKYFSTANVPQRLATPAEQSLFNEQVNMRKINRPGFSITRDPLYDAGNPTMPDLTKARELGLEYGTLPQKYGTYNAEEISNLPSSEMLHRGVSTGVDAGTQIVDNTRTGAVTETSWMDKFKDELPGSLGEAGDRLVDPKSGVFSKQAMATGLGQLGANILMPEEVEELTVDEGPDPYVLRDRDYVYKRKKPSFIDGLTPSQIRELYEKGGIDRRFYEQPSSGEGVFPLTAQSGGGIEDLIEMSETVGVQQTPFEGKIPGQGHGMQDNVMMPILERGGVAAVSPKEYVVPADVMSMIGNGNADSGAEAMDGFIADFRTAKYGRPTQPPQIDGRSALQSLMKT